MLSTLVVGKLISMTIFQETIVIGTKNEKAINWMEIFLMSTYQIAGMRKLIIGLFYTS